MNKTRCKFRLECRNVRRLLALCLLGLPLYADAATPTNSEIDAKIDGAGRSLPDWWQSVPLKYPQTLDLSWPEQPPGPWNARKNVGQYMWSVINENPGSWASGTKFMHYLLGMHKNNPRVLGKAIGQLAHCYHDLLRDWPRAAFWRRKQIERDVNNVNARVQLAECYWKLGSKRMAVSQLNTVSRYCSPAMIKLWSEMGELDKGLAVAATLANYYPWMAYLSAGNACRLHGRFTQAVGFYEKVLEVPPAGPYGKRIEQYHDFARANLEGVKRFDALDLRRVADGSHTARSMSYAGPMEVVVVVNAGRIVSVKVTRHEDKQFFGAITETPRLIVQRQGLKGVDAVTGATITSEAIINAVAKALARATK